jgi:hypothetical protein
VLLATRNWLRTSGPRWVGGGACCVWCCVCELEALLLLRVRYVYVLVCWCSSGERPTGGVVGVTHHRTAASRPPESERAILPTAPHAH